MSANGTFTTAELEDGKGLYVTGPTKVFSYDDGQTWHTCQINDGVRGNPTHVLYVPAGGTWADAA